LLDIATAPLFAEEELEKERGVLLDELASTQDQPLSLLQDLFSQALWPGHPLSLPIIGTQANLRRFHRKDLCEFYDKHYRLDNACISFAGKISHSKALSLLQPLLGRWQKTAAKKRASKPPKLKLSSPYLVKARSFEQAHLQMGFPIDPSQRWASFVLNTLFGENMNSRLFQKVREEKGLAYYVASECSFYEDVGYFALCLSADEQKLAEALQACQETTRSLLSAPPTQKEVAMAKNYLLGSALQELENTLNVALWIGENHLYGRPEADPAHFFAQLLAVDTTEVNSLAHALFSRPRWKAALLCKKGRKEDFEKMLQEVLGENQGKANEDLH
jgi:predicted Zn-dependent peptidase